MADNTTIALATTGDTIRDVSKSGIKTQVTILDLGGAGAESLLTAANPMPVAPGLGLVYSGSTPLTVASAFANLAAAGLSAPIVAGVAGKRVYVLGYTIKPASAAVAVYFASSGGAAIDATAYLAANGGFGKAAGPFALFGSLAGEGLCLDLSAAADVGVSVLYVQA